MSEIFLAERRRPPVLEFDGVAVRYGAQRVLHDATLRVDSGELMALVGPSGCGKSSLLSAVNRLNELVPSCVVEGSIRLGGQDVRDTRFPVHQLRRRVGMVFQQPNPFPLSIAENILFPLREQGIGDKAELQRRLEQALRAVGLWDEVAMRLTTSATKLSGGQQQRLCFARALALEPEVLLLDEPCSALDPISTEIVEKLICSLKGRYTILMVTHNLAQARRIADSVTVCWVDQGCGCVVESGTCDQVFDAPASAITRAYCAGRIG